MEWETIPGFSKYEASKCGKIRTKKTGRIRKNPKHPQLGYTYIGLTNDKGIKRTKYVHQLIAATFLGPYPSQNHVVHHIDGNKTNNKTCNLKYVTRSTNMKFAQSNRKQNYSWKKKKYTRIQGEIWKDIPGTANQVSNLGRVRSKHGRDFWWIRRQSPNTQGYLQIGLSYNGKHTCVRTHTLVATAFLGAPPTSQHVVNHIDGNITNNNASNLEWVTRSENAKHAYANGLIAPQKGHKNNFALAPPQIHEIHTRLLDGDNIEDITQDYPVSSNTILKIKRGKYRKEEIATPEQILKIGIRHKKNNTSRKLTDEQILEIYKRAHNGESPSKIAKDYNISQPLVSNIKAERVHKKITSPSKRNNKHLIFQLTTEEIKKAKEEYVKHNNVTLLANKYDVEYHHMYKMLNQ